MNHVMQPKNGLCMAACVAMLTNTSLDDVLTKARILKATDLGGMEYLPTNEAIIYLARHMLCYGIVGGPIEFTKETKIVSFGISLEQNALLGVPSPNYEGEQHAVVWDASIQMIRDPLKAEPQSLLDYKVLEWAPIVEIPNMSAERL